MWVFAGLLAGAYLLPAAYLSYRLIGNPTLTRGQKAIQLPLIWLLPFLSWFLVAAALPGRQDDRWDIRFARQEDEINERLDVFPRVNGRDTSPSGHSSSRDQMETGYD